MGEIHSNINDELLVKYLLQETSSDESHAVEQWMNEGEHNRKYYEQLQNIWNKSRAMASENRVDEELAWKRFQSRIKSSDPVIAIHRRTGWLRIAALLIVIAGVVLLSYILVSEKAPVEQLSLHTTNSVLTDTLPDGSVITLNKNSTLIYPETFGSKKRSVDLNGEAFFNIKADPNKPFEISVNDITVRVLGTSFNIKSENGITEVIVETGIVQVIKKHRSVELKPNQKLVVEPHDSVLIPQIEKEQLYNYYRSKEFVCENTPLWKLAAVLNEAYGVNIVIERDELRTLPLDVTFSNESLDVILEIIKETFNTYQIEIVKKDSSIILR